jgi:hypothetical protein
LSVKKKSSAQPLERGTLRREPEIPLAALEAHLVLVRRREIVQVPAHFARMRVEEPVLEAARMRAAADRFAVRVEEQELHALKPARLPQTDQPQLEALDRERGGGLADVAPRVREPELHAEPALRSDVAEEVPVVEQLADHAIAVMHPVGGLE